MNETGEGGAMTPRMEPRTALDPDPLEVEEAQRNLDRVLYRMGYDAAIEDCTSAWRSGAVIVAGALLFAGLLGAALSLAWRRG